MKVCRTYGALVFLIYVYPTLTGWGYLVPRLTALSLASLAKPPPGHGHGVIARRARVPQKPPGHNMKNRERGRRATVLEISSAYTAAGEWRFLWPLPLWLLGALRFQR